MSDMVRGQLTKIERNKLVSLITMEIHNRLVLCFVLHGVYTSLLGQVRSLYRRDVQHRQSAVYSKRCTTNVCL